MSSRDRQKENLPEDHEEFVKGRLKWEQEVVTAWTSEGGDVFWGPEGRAELRNSCSRYAICSPMVAGILPELAYRGDFCPLTFVLSKSEPFNEEMLMSFDRIVNWLSLYQATEYLKIHVSGHGGAADIQAVIDAANPDKVLPIHTRHPRTFSQMHDRVIVDAARGSRVAI